MPDFNYTEPASVVVRTGDSTTLRMPFESFAVAVKHAIEDVPGDPETLAVVTNDRSFNHAELREAYDSQAFPLARAHIARDFDDWSEGLA